MSIRKFQSDVNGRHWILSIGQKSVSLRAKDVKGVEELCEEAIRWGREEARMEIRHALGVVNCECGDD